MNQKWQHLINQTTSTVTLNLTGGKDMSKKKIIIENTNNETQLTLGDKLLMIVFVAIGIPLLLLCMIKQHF